MSWLTDCETSIGLAQLISRSFSGYCCILQAQTGLVRLCLRKESGTTFTDSYRIIESKGPALGAVLLMWPPQGRAEGKITSLTPLASLCALHSRVPLAFLAIRTHRWLMANLWSSFIQPLVNFCSTIGQPLISHWSSRAPRSFSVELLSSRLTCTDGWRYSSPGCRTQHLPSLNFMIFFAHLSSLSRSLNGSAVLCCICHSTPFGIISKLPSSSRFMTKSHRAVISKNKWR